MKKCILSCIILFHIVAACGQTAAQTIASTTFKDFGMYSPHPIINGHLLNTFNNSENTKGRRYFFDDWVKGYVINGQGIKINVDSFWFNFDKITNNILVTVNKSNIIEVDKEGLRGFCFVSGGQAYTFNKILSVSTGKFLQVLAGKDSTGYRLYKITSTRLIKANYTTDGLTESGNPYDEYVDVAQYYIQLPAGKGIVPVPLKSKNIKEALTNEKIKVNDWFITHHEDDLDEQFLIGLISSLNE